MLTSFVKDIGSGQIIATGKPKDVVANPASHTRRYLAPLFRGKK